MSEAEIRELIEGLRELADAGGLEVDDKELIRKAANQLEADLDD